MVAAVLDGEKGARVPLDPSRLDRPCDTRLRNVCDRRFSA